MIRRFPLLASALAVAGAVTLSSCVGPDTDAAARVNGTSVPQRVLDTLLAAEAPAADGSSGEVDPTAAGQTARGYLTSLIKAETARQVAQQFGIDLAAGRDESIKAITGKFTGDRLAKWNALSTDEKSVIADFSVAMTAMQGRAGDAPADLEQRYENPASTGFYCIRFLFLDSEAAANEAYSQLSNGADFAEYANTLNKQANGGALTSQLGSACLPTDQFGAQSVDPAIAAALHDGKPGVVSKPVKANTDQGAAWILLLHRPWSEISKDLTAAVSASPSYAAYLGLLATGKVSVASKYGEWNAALGAVEQHA